MKLTNEELCVLAQSGEQWAAEEILRRNEMLIKKIAGVFCYEYNVSRIMGVDADDIEQEARIKACELIYKFDPDKNTKFSTFLFRSIKRKLIDYFEQQEREVGFENIEFEDDSIFCDSYEWDANEHFQLFAEVYDKTPEPLCLQMESCRELHDALDAIPLRNKRYLEYRFGFGDYIDRTKKETAKYFHLSISRAEKLEKTSLSMMREKLL